VLLFVKVRKLEFMALSDRIWHCCMDWEI